MKIYFDMDGVLADFDRGVRELCHMEPSDPDHPDEKYDDDMWAAIRDVGHYYDKLEPVEGSLELFKKVFEKYGDDCQILTAVPKPKRQIVTAGEDKVSWVHRLISPDVAVNRVAREEKKNYVTGADCFLVDDLQKNIEEWQALGGKGIRFLNAEQAEKDLEAAGVL